MSDLRTTINGLVAIATHRTEASPLSRYEQAEQLGRAARSMLAAGIPAAHVWDALRPDQRDTEAMRAAKRWAAWPVRRKPWETVDPPKAPRDSGILLLAGDLGTGKSAAAAWLVSARVNAGRAAGRWLSCPGLAKRQQWPDKGESAEERRRRIADGGATLSEMSADLVAATCLVIDDLGGDDSLAKHVSEWLAGIIHARHRAGLLTIITTNAAGLLRTIIGERQFDRLMQPGAGEMVACTGASLRSSVRAVAGIPPEIEAANRLVHLVRRLGKMNEPRDRLVAELPESVAAEQLCVLLGVSEAEAIEWGEEWAAEAESQAEEGAGLLEQLAAQQRERQEKADREMREIVERAKARAERYEVERAANPPHPERAANDKPRPKRGAKP